MSSEPAAKKQRCADQRQSIDSSPQAGDAAEASKPAEEAVTIIIEDSDEAIGSVEEAQVIDTLEEAAAVENAEEVQTAMLTRTQRIEHLTAEVNQRNEQARRWAEFVCAWEHHYFRVAAGDITPPLRGGWGVPLPPCSGCN